MLVQWEVEVLGEVRVLSLGWAPERSTLDNPLWTGCDARSKSRVGAELTSHFTEGCQHCALRASLNKRLYPTKAPQNKRGNPGESHGAERGHMETLCSRRHGAGLFHRFTREEAKWAARPTCSPRSRPPCCLFCFSVGFLSASTRATCAAGRAGEDNRAHYRQEKV